MIHMMNILRPLQKGHRMNGIQPLDFTDILAISRNLMQKILILKRIREEAQVAYRPCLSKLTLVGIHAFCIGLHMYALRISSDSLLKINFFYKSLSLFSIYQ